MLIDFPGTGAWWIKFTWFEFLVCFVNELELYLSLNIMVSLSCSVRWATVKLLAWWMFTSAYFYSEDRLIVFQCAWKVFWKFCPLCYKQVITLSPRRFKDKFSLVISKFSQIALVAARLWQFCENFENTRESLSLNLLGPMRLHIQTQCTGRFNWTAPQQFYSIFMTTILLWIKCEEDHGSYRCNFCSCEKKAWKNSGSYGFKPLTSAIPANDQFPVGLLAQLVRALHRYRRGQGLESRTTLNFFPGFFLQMQKLHL